MPQVQTCPKCQSVKLIPRARVRGDLGSLQDLCVEVYERPEALIFKDVHRAELSARVCGECGYTELYVDNPQGLYSVYSAARGAED